MRILTILLLFGPSTLTWSQPVLSITNARQPNSVAPYVYFLEDFTYKLTYEQVSHFSLDSFQLLEYVLEFYSANLLMRKDMKAIRNMASELSTVFSTSRNNRRLKLSPGGKPQPKLRSTGQRRAAGAVLLRHKTLAAFWLLYDFCLVTSGCDIRHKTHRSGGPVYSRDQRQSFSGGELCL